MALVTRKVTETVSVVQEATNGTYLTLYDLAEFAQACAQHKIQGDTGIVVRLNDVTKRPSALATRADFITEGGDDETDPMLKSIPGGAHDG